MNRFDIVIDPGHGGDQAAGRSSPLGVRGPGGTLEKDVTLRLAERLAAALGAQARLTRTSDVNPSLAARAEVARRSGARAFVSLHANGGRPGERGAEAWVHARAPQASRSLAERLLAAMAALPGAPAGRGVKTGELAVLTPEALVPATAACLLEVDFLTDAAGERRLTDDGALDGIAQAVARALRDHLAAGRAPAPPFPALPLSDAAREAGRHQVDQVYAGQAARHANGYGFPHGAHEMYDDE
jgi:N-acetylmuramoyl-L-alanine amidase